MSRKAVLITGGAKRVGRMFSLFFAERGYDVLISYLSSEDQVHTLEKYIKDNHDVNFEAVKADLTKSEGVDLLCEKMFSVFPHCNALVNNACLFKRVGFLETDDAILDDTISLGLLAPFKLSRFFVQGLTGETVSNIINIVDDNLEKQKHSPYFAYMMTKSGLAHFTKQAALEKCCTEKRVTINGLCPGTVIPLGKTVDDSDYAQSSVAKELMQRTEEILGDSSINGRLYSVAG